MHRLLAPSIPQLASLGAAFTFLLLNVPTANAATADAASAAAIRRLRMGTLVVEAAPGASVQVEQTRHEFWFGAALASGAFDGGMPAAEAARYKQVFLENFNAAVPENALKWLAMERRRGEVHYETVDAILDWTEQHQLPVRGHNIYWGVKQWTLDWMKALDDTTLRETLKARAHDIGRRYRGRFAEYDLNNEMIHGNFYADRLGQGITLDMANWVREADPQAVLYVNDYDILTCNRLDPYVAHIRELLKQGVPIGGIGVQGHLHGDTFDPMALEKALDVLAQFHLPIRVTEFNFPGQRSKFYQHPKLEMTADEEQVKAEALTEYFRICFGHPAVEGILLWGFWEGDNWIPQSSLYRRDWSPTPAAQAYRNLVFRDWWTRWDGKAGANGRCEIPAFFGRYRVTVNGRVFTAELTKKVGTALVRAR